MITNKFGSYLTAYTGLRLQAKRSDLHFGTQADTQPEEQREDDADSFMSASTGSASVFRDYQYDLRQRIVRVIPSIGQKNSEKQKKTIRNVRKQANDDPQLRQELRKNAWILGNHAAQKVADKYPEVRGMVPLDISEEEFKVRPREERHSFHRLAMRLHNKSQNSSFLERWFGIGGKQWYEPLE